MLMPRKSEFYTFKGTWTDSTVFSLDTNDKFRLNRLPDDLYIVSRGALYYVVPVAADKAYTEGNTYPYSEYELSASGGWNFAVLAEDKDRFSKSVTFEDKPLTSFPFSSATPAVEMFCCGQTHTVGHKRRRGCQKTACRRGFRQKGDAPFYTLRRNGTPHGGSARHNAERLIRLSAQKRIKRKLPQRGERNIFLL